MNNLILSNGISIPSIGIGTYPLFGNVLKDVVYNAYNIGYRLIDTADNYYNEEDLGYSLKNLYQTTNAKREELFIVTKISDELYHPKELGGGSNKGIYFWKNSPIMQQPNAVKNIVRTKVENSLRFLQTNYLDAILMHWPYPDFFEDIWYEMEQIYKEGKVRSIGVCNCRERHLLTLKKSCSIMPMINEFESSPLNTKITDVEFCKKNNIQIIAYSPLKNLQTTQSKPYLNYIKTLSIKYNKTAAQIVLRFDVQRGIIPIPKSSHKKRLESNFDIFDFNLTNEEINKLASFNENKQFVAESRSCPGL